MNSIGKLPWHGNGVCLVCEKVPSEEEIFVCNLCLIPWHLSCLATVARDCPNCMVLDNDDVSFRLFALFQMNEADTTISKVDKAKRRHQLLNGDSEVTFSSEKCSSCCKTLDMPVSIPCGHNFCLICFKKLTEQGIFSCVVCKEIIPLNMIIQPRINIGLVDVIRRDKLKGKNGSTSQAIIVPHFMFHQNRPDTAFRFDRAKQENENASSEKIIMTISSDHFGPILAEHDPERNRGVLVGDGWSSRLDCRQCGVHFPRVARISGHAQYGAQSVVLSGEYEDDEDHGEWFLYTGSGGRNISEDECITTCQSSHQTFDNSNEALRLSCEKGYPVRVVRSYKENRSSYAPSLETGSLKLRYDGIYRVEKCWQSEGRQGFILCRYLFCRCDNVPAPWTNELQSDVPRDLPVVPELKEAINIFERKQKPMWDYDSQNGCWKWTSRPPDSKIVKIQQISKIRRKGKRVHKTGDIIHMLTKKLKRKRNH